MGPYPQTEYSLRYDKHGVETEINRISPLLTAEEFTIDQVDEELRPKFYIMREAISISRRFKYDMDLFAECGLRVVVYHDFSACIGLTEVMRLFGLADLAWISKHKRGKSVALTAIYLISVKKSET